MDIINSLMMCADSVPTLFGLFDLSLAPPLLFYSYIPIGLIILMLGLYVSYKAGYTVSSKALLLLAVIFILYILDEILLWISMPAGLVYFGWSLLIILRLFIIAGVLYLCSSFIHKSFPFYLNVLIALILLPALVLLPTTLNVESFDINSCEAINGPLWYYLYIVEFIAISFFVVTSIKYYLTYIKTKNHLFLQNALLLFGFGILLATFSLSTILGNLTLTYEINLIGPLGMVIFMGILSYVIVKFHTFNIKLLATQALVWGLIILIGSQIFFVDTTVNYILVTVTFILACFGGYFLTKSVKKEVQQREEIALLAEGLKKANDRLKILDRMKSEFVSIASHQLRSPLTSIRGYASMLAEESYGKLPIKAKEAAIHIAESAKYMVLSVEDYLSVSRIEAGNMKYELSDFNLKETAEKIVDELRSVAMKKGLIMVFRSECSGSCSINADIGKTRQIIMNLLDNSMKYTKQGTITVVTHDDVKKKKVYVTIQDTGVGMSKETVEDVFEKFVRAKNANNINSTGTGLGLFVAKKMVEAMHGHIWAESEGDGKGSTFHIEFPLLSGKPKPVK